MQNADGTSYHVFGSRNSPAVVLIHGLGLCQKLWDPMLLKLAQSHYVITYDLYGHGDSEPHNETASLEVYAHQIVGLLDALDIERAHIVGFSIGGMINRRFALDYPQRMKSIVILNSPHNRGIVAQQAVVDRAKTVRDQGALATMDTALARWFTHDFLTDHSEITQRVVDWRMQVDSEGYAQTAWVLAVGVTELIQPDPAVVAPCLVVTSENDTGSTPAMAHAIADEIDGTETIIVPRLKHLGLMQDPDAFLVPVLEFLDRQKD
jgi:pimeloyl-ACP methyl ester carboxylesterase